MMDRFDEATTFGLVLTAVEMGQAMTEAGAISAVATFFRQKLDARAWTENASSPIPTAATTATAVPPITASATDAPLLLRLPLGASAATADNREGAPAAPPRPPLDLVVSRGPGPTFSASETRVAAQAAALLRQALARVRDRGLLAKAEAALESSLRGMQEASEAVAVLVGERKRRAQRQEQQLADVAKEHGRALSAAGDKLARSRAETEGFRRRLAGVEEAVAVVAGAANALCRAASWSNRGVLGGGEGVGVGVGEGVGVRVSEGVGAEVKVGTRAETEVGELVAEAERAARKALHCFFARVERASKYEAADPGVDWRGEEDASPGTRKPLREPLRAGEHNVNETCARNLKIRVPVPQCDNPAAPLVLSLRRRSRESDFTEGDERLASALAACLSTAMSTLREKQRSLNYARRMEADRKARAGHEETAAAVAAAASADARERRERAIAGTRALAAAAQASEARAESEAEAATRAERQMEALQHLLSGLGAAGGDHAAVAEAVAERAAAAVPTCVSSVLLTPRQGNRCRGRYERAPPPPRIDAACGDGAVFSPDPRVWAACASKEHRRRGSSERNAGRGRKSGRWAEAIGKAASQAASSGKTVCVRDRGVDTSLGAEAGASTVFVACFSPVCVAAPASAPEIESKTNAHGAKENLRPATLGGVVGTNAVPGERAWPRGADGSICVIAWMLSLGARVLDADGSGQSKARSPAAAAVAASTRSFATTATAAEGTMITTPTTLPPWVSAAIEGVAHAVGLAVSSATGDGFDLTGKSRSASFGTARGWDGLVADSSTAGGLSTINDHHSRREGGHELLLGGRRSGYKISRNEDLSRLREGTSALSGRVQTLERRAAGLRASEARSAAALSRARVDAMAVKGQLQLAGLERDRLLSRLKETEGRAVQREAAGVGRRPLTAARLTGNRGDTVPPAVPPLGWREGGGRTARALLSAWSPPSKERTGIVKVVTTNARPEGGSWTVREAAVPGGVGNPGAAATSAQGRATAVTEGGGGEASRRFDSPESVGADDASSSSQALQRMASLHARLSDSLRRGGVSWRMGGDV